MTAAANVMIQRINDVTIATIQEPRLLESKTLDAVGTELFKLVDQMDRKKLVVDCTKVAFLSSAAISVFLSLHKKSGAIKGTVIICGLRKELMQVFEITKLNKLLKFAADEKAALQQLGFQG